MASKRIIIKKPHEIEMMRRAGRLVHQVLSRMKDLVHPGVTTLELALEAERLIIERGGRPLFKGVKNPEAGFPFPSALCASLNDQVVHGIPSPVPLKEGDILSLDCGVSLEGYCGDSAVTLPVGRIRPEAQRLIDLTRSTLDLAIALIEPGKRWSAIAAELQRHVESSGMTVVRDFVGHGIGKNMHEEPKIPNYWGRDSKGDFELASGMTLAVEPMVNLGSPEVCYADHDRWCVVTRDGSLSAHFEHTVAVTESGCEVLTLDDRTQG